jgi:hypothetical protein
VAEREALKLWCGLDVPVLALLHRVIFKERAKPPGAMESRKGEAVASSSKVWPQVTAPKQTGWWSGPEWVWKQILLQRAP